MFSALVVFYLLLGGSGAGAAVALSVMECCDAQRHQGQAHRAAVALAGLRGSEAPGVVREAYGAKRRACDVKRHAHGAYEAGWNAHGAERSAYGVKQLACDAKRRARGVRASARPLGLPRNFYARAWPLAFVLLAAGALCLLCDIGRPDRLLALVSHPSMSAIAVGAWAIVVCMLVAGTFAALSLFEGVDVPLPMVRALGVAGVGAGLATAAYTGVLLQGMASVVFWQTAFLPAAFVCSSASCGVACVFVALAFTESRQSLNAFAIRLARVDSVLIVIEAACVAGLLAVGLANPGANDAAWALVGGERRWLFWGGLVAGGLVAPFALERASVPEGRRTLLLWTACLVLVGGLVLRWCVVLAAGYDVTQIPGAVYGLAGSML